MVYNVGLGNVYALFGHHYVPHSSSLKESILNWHDRLLTEETAETQQVSHRLIKCQSRLWSQRGTKVNNGPHHDDNPLLKPTGIQIATKRYVTRQAMTPTNVKTVHQTSLLHIESNLWIISDCCRLPTISGLSNKADKLRSNQF